MILFVLGSRFWSLLGLQVRRAACSARRVKSHSMDAFGNSCLETLRGGPRLLRRGPAEPCWGHVGLVLGPCWHYVGSWAPFFRSWPLLERFLNFFCSCWSFFSGFGSLWTRFCVVWGRFWSFQNYIFRCFSVLASTHHRNALHATKPQFLRCFIHFGHNR